MRGGESERRGSGACPIYRREESPPRPRARFLDEVAEPTRGGRGRRWGGRGKGPGGRGRGREREEGGGGETVRRWGPRGNGGGGPWGPPQRGREKSFFFPGRAGAGGGARASRAASAWRIGSGGPRPREWRRRAHTAWRVRRRAMRLGSRARAGERAGPSCLSRSQNSCRVKLTWRTGSSARARPDYGTVGQRPGGGRPGAWVQSVSSADTCTCVCRQPAVGAGRNRCDVVATSRDRSS